MTPPVALEGLGLLAGEVSYRMMLEGVDLYLDGSAAP